MRGISQPKGASGIVELISVHLPKCGGTALRHALENSFGADRVLLDYDDRPLDPTAPMNLDPIGFRERALASGYEELDRYDVVHGHLWPAKYDGISNATRITVLRHPLPRTISHYFFWRDYRRHGHVLHDYMLDHDLTLVEFARLPMISGFYRDVFFRDVDPAMFDLIGDVTEMDSTVSRLEDLVGRRLPLAEVNTNPANGYTTTREQILANAPKRRALEAELAEDIAFYREWTSMSP